MSRFLVKEKYFYKTFYTLTAWMALQSLITYAVGLADSVMLSNYSEYALSGAAVVNQIQFLLQTLVAGVSAGITIMSAQYWGGKDIVSIKRIMGLGMRLSAVIGLVFMVVSLAWPRQLVGLLAADEEVISQGAEYLSVLGYSFIVFALSNTLLMSLRAVESTAIGPISSLAALVVNILLNYVLIFGKLGAPELGIIGAAIATTISRVVELAIVWLYLRFADKKLNIHLRDFFMSAGGYIKDYALISLPCMGSNGLWGLAQAVQTAILGHMSAATIAANSVTATVYQVLTVIILASSSSSAIVIGKTIGEGRLDMIKPYARTMQILFVAHGIMAAALLYLLKGAIISIFGVSDETAALAGAFLTIMSVTVIGTSYEFPVGSGIVQGGGDTKYAFIVDNLFMWLIAIPFAAMSAFWWNLSPVWTFIFLKSDQVLKCIPHFFKVNSFKWVRVLTK